MSNSDFVEQKRREALAIYESQQLYMDSQEPHYYAPSSFEDRELPRANTDFVANGNHHDVDQTVALSPRSAVTEPRSNKRGASRRSSLKANNQESLENHSYDAPDTLKSDGSGDGSLAKKRRGRMSTGSNVNASKAFKATEKRVRGKSQERGRRGESPEREKKGFFRKIFRGGKKKSTEGQVNGRSPKPMEPTTKGKSKGIEARPDGLDFPVLPPHKPTPQDSQAEYKGFDDEFHFKEANQVSREPKVALEVDAKPRAMQLGMSPRGNSNELDLGMNLDTVTSGLTNDMEPDRRDIFFAHDEVSTLTAPSAHSYSRRSVDPDPVEGATVSSGHSSEPIGHYWNGAGAKNRHAAPTPKAATPTIDPFNEPFFREPDGESPVACSRGIKTKSRQDNHLPKTKDPMGETPTAKSSPSHANEPSPTGPMSPKELKDPLGSTAPDSGSRRSAESPSKSLVSPTSDSTPLREPSAFRDGSPYTLDPPLRVHDGEKVAKPIAAALFHQLPRVKKDGDGSAEPPTPTAAAATKNEAPTPSTVSDRSAPMIVPTGVNETLAPKPVLKEQNAASTGSHEGTTPSRSTSSAENVMKQESPDATGFLDDLFQEKAPTRKRMSIVRPISIHMTDSSTGTKVDMDKSSSPVKSASQVIEIHRTQRLSVSPRSNKVGPWKLPVESTEAAALPLSVAEASKADRIFGNRSSRFLHNEEEEEKKEQEQEKVYSSAEPKAVMATSITALSTAACLNAKTVAYLHTLNGEPSPRHSWRRAELSDDDYSPVKSGTQAKEVSNIKVALSKKRDIPVCSTDEAAFDSFISSCPRKVAVNAKASAISSMKRNIAVCSTDEAAFDSFITSGQTKATAMAKTRPKLQQETGLGRKEKVGHNTKPVVSITRPSKTQKAAKENTKLQLRAKYGALSPRSRKVARENFRRPLYYFRFNRDVRVTGLPLTFGLDLIRRKRLEDILNGDVIPVYKDKSLKTKKPPPAPFQCLVEKDIKDPIQRAGFRLLSKAAIPIQASARRYLARREAITRMSATIVMQSYFRRWKCEAYLRAYRFACVKIQSAFRSWLVQGEIAYKHYHATQIQKVVRGYIAAAYVYDTIYWVSKVQAAMRGKLARVRFAALKRLRERSAVRLQASCRGYKARRHASRCIEAARTIQAHYRRTNAKGKYASAISHIIAVQSLVRRFLSRREAGCLRLAKRNAAACKIQATWRGFQGYTDYIFALVDILVIQRSMRKYLANKKVESMRRERAAIKIQAQWRRQTALIGMLYDLVHIIIVQSVARRFLAKKIIPQKRREYSRRMERQQMLDSAATRIQTAWRGFWAYSHFIIMQYEIIRLQAIIRGRSCRNSFSLKLGCCIMLQSAIRRHLANKVVLNMKLTQASLGTRVEGLRNKLACRRIQFWWRVVIECNREKKAALIIERFFLMVKAEVDREIVRQREQHTKELQQMKEIQSKLKPNKVPGQQKPQLVRRHSSVSDADERLLENVWKNTVDDDNADVLPSAAHEVGGKAVRPPSKARSHSAPRLHQNPSYVSPASSPGPSPVVHRPSSPTMNLVMRHDREKEMRARKEEALKASRRIQQRSSTKLPQDVMLAKSASELSAITSPTVFSNAKKGGRSNSKKSRRRQSNPVEDDVSIEGSLFGEDILQSARNNRAPPSQGSKKQHFFSDAQRSGGTRQRASSVTSEVSDDASGLKSHMYSGTATTVTRTTTSQIDTIDSGLSPRSEMADDLDIRKASNQSLSSGMDRRYGGDKYSSAASKGRKLIESHRGRKSSNVSPRHGQIVVTNVPTPILSQDSHDNVEVEYGGEQFGMI